MRLVFSARPPMRTTASSTPASTAALRPKNSARDDADVADQGVDQLRAHDGATPGQHEEPPATEPPIVGA
jgi:hypothetical protein